MGGKTERGRPRWLVIAMVVAIAVSTAAVVTVTGLGIRPVDAMADPLPQPETGFDYAWWNDALGRWVSDGKVDYGKVLADESGLRRFVATLGTVGPKNTPARFSTKNEQLAYYINAYNALVLLGVVANWPITSVQDVRGWLEPRAGFGFFYGLRFMLDGERINLYNLEHGVIRAFNDARIHAAINCASISCPPLAPYAFEPAQLDKQLDVVTQRFCSQPPYVVVDASAKQTRLSAIFEWYRSDFEADAERFGKPPTIVDYVLHYADAPTRAALQIAQTAEFTVSFEPYNWGLNTL